MMTKELFNYKLLLRLFLLLLLLRGTAGMSYAQSIFRINNDSVHMRSLGNTGTELILENDTRALTGAFLKNRFNGRTEFAYAIDSSKLSNDTLYFHRGNGWFGIKLPAGGGGGITYNAGYGLILSSQVFRIDTVAMATRARLYKALDSSLQLKQNVLNFQNGFTLSNNTVFLGGPLTTSTTFTGRSSSVVFGSPANRINSFSLNTRNGIFLGDTINNGSSPYVNIAFGELNMSGQPVTIHGPVYLPDNASAIPKVLTIGSPGLITPVNFSVVNDSPNVVHKTLDEFIMGTKTFGADLYTVGIHGLSTNTSNGFTPYTFIGNSGNASILKVGDEANNERFKVANGLTTNGQTVITFGNVVVSGGVISPYNTENLNFQYNNSATGAIASIRNFGSNNTEVTRWEGLVMKLPLLAGSPGVMMATIGTDGSIGKAAIPTGGGVTATGSDGYIPYFSGGQLVSDSNLTYDAVNRILRLRGDADIDAVATDNHDVYGPSRLLGAHRIASTPAVKYLAFDSTAHLVGYVDAPAGNSTSDSAILVVRFGEAGVYDIPNSIARKIKVYINPEVVQGSVTINMPATPGIDQQEYEFFFGGLITTGNTVITSLTINAGDGRSVRQDIAPTTIRAFETLNYNWDYTTQAFWRAKY